MSPEHIRRHDDIEVVRVNDGKSDATTSRATTGGGRRRGVAQSPGRKDGATGTVQSGDVVRNSQYRMDHRIYVSLDGIISQNTEDDIQATRAQMLLRPFDERSHEYRAVKVAIYSEWIATERRCGGNMSGCQQALGSKLTERGHRQYPRNRRTRVPDGESEDEETATGNAEEEQCAEVDRNKREDLACENDDIMDVTGDV